MSRQITYIGLERCDVVYHLGNVLAASTKGKVLVADNSLCGDLIDAVSKAGESEIYERKNVTYARCLNVEQSGTDDFDYILVYAGENVESGYITEDTSILCMPDYTKHSLDYMLCVPRLEDSIIIMRDACTKKVTDKSMADLLHVYPKLIAGHVVLSEKDMAAYIALTHNGHQKITGTSDNMQEALNYIVQRLFETDYKKAKKMLNASKKV